MENACKRRGHMFLSIVPHHPRASISVSVSIIGDQRPCIHIEHGGVKIRLGEVLKCASWRVAVYTGVDDDPSRSDVIWCRKSVTVLRSVGWTGYQVVPTPAALSVVSDERVMRYSTAIAYYVWRRPAKELIRTPEREELGARRRRERKNK